MAQNLIPEGSYLARGTSLTMVKSSKKYTPGATVVFSIIDKGPYENRQIEWTGWLSDKTQEQTAESLAICGYDGENEKTISSNVVQLIVEHEAYTNEEGVTYTNAKVRWVNDPNRARTMFAPMDEASALEAKSRLRGLVLASREARAKLGSSGDGGSFNFGANAQPTQPANGNGSPPAPVPPAAPPPPAGPAGGIPDRKAMF